MNEEITYRGMGRVESSNKGYWGTQRLVTAESWNEEARRRNDLARVQWELELWRMCHLAGSPVIEGGTHSQGHDPKWRRRGEEITHPLSPPTFQSSTCAAYWQNLIRSYLARGPPWHSSQTQSIGCGLSIDNGWGWWWGKMGEWRITRKGDLLS